jgi:hypothetical protein
VESQIQAGALPERRRVPAAVRGPYLLALRAAWRIAREAEDAEHPALALALAAYARDGRARGVPIVLLLRARDTIVRPGLGGDLAVDFGRVREWAGAEVIRRYHQDD